jgi:hypothetical protein
VFSIALAVRLVVVALVLPELKSDSNPDYYRELGRNILAGKGFVAVAPSGITLPNLDRVPGYPAFLAGMMVLAGDRLVVLLAANCILAALICVLVTMWASRWLSTGASFAAGLICALEPNSALRCAMPMTEQLFTLVLVGGACLLSWHPTKRWVWLAAGLCWGVAALTRPIGLWLWVVVLVAAFACSHSVRRGAVLFALFLSVFLPLTGCWMIRNYRVTGHWFYSTSSIYYRVVMWAGRMEARRTGDPLEIVHKRLLARTGEIQFYEGPSQIAKMLHEQGSVMKESCWSSPMIFLAESVKGLGATLFGPGRQTLHSMLIHPSIPSRWWPVVYSSFLVVFVIAAIAGAAICWRRLWFVVLLAFYFIVLSTGPIGHSRLRYPMIPMFAILAVAGLSRLKGDSCHKTFS